MHRMMLLMLTAKYYHGDDDEFLRQKNIDGEVELLPVCANKHDGLNDDKEASITNTYSQVVAAADRRNLERINGASLFHVGKNAAKAEGTQGPTGGVLAADVAAFAAVGAPGAKPREHAPNGHSKNKMTQRSTRKQTR
jgi:hypothetical protein